MMAKVQCWGECAYTEETLSLIVDCGPSWVALGERIDAVLVHRVGSNIKVD